MEKEDDNNWQDKVEDSILQDNENGEEEEEEEEEVINTSTIRP